MGGEGPFLASPCHEPPKAVVGPEGLGREDTNKERHEKKRQKEAKKLQHVDREKHRMKGT